MNDPDRNTMRDTAAIVLLAVAVTFGCAGALLLVTRPNTIQVVAQPPLSPVAPAQQSVTQADPIPSAVPPDAKPRPPVGEYEYELNGQFNGQVTALATAPPLVENGYEVVGPTSRKPSSPHPGQRYLDTDLNTYSIYNGTSWVAVNTSSGIGAIDDVGDVTIVSGTVGDFLGWDGVVWTDIAVYLDTLNDVAITTPAVKHTLRHNGTTWVNSQLAATDLSDINFSSLADNDLAVYDSATSKWLNESVYENRREFSVTDYGAIPDDGTADTTDIQEAIDAAEAYVALSSSNDATVTIPRGVFLVAGVASGIGAVDVAGDGITISGEGTLKLVSGDDADAVLSLSGDYCIVEGIRIDGNEGGTPTGRGEGLRIIGDYCTARGVHVRNTTAASGAGATFFIQDGAVGTLLEGCVSFESGESAVSNRGDFTTIRDFRALQFGDHAFGNGGGDKDQLTVDGWYAESSVTDNTGFLLDSGTSTHTGFNLEHANLSNIIINCGDSATYGNGVKFARVHNLNIDKMQVIHTSNAFHSFRIGEGVGNVRITNSHFSGDIVQEDGAFDITGSITAAANNGSGFVRFTSASHALKTGDFIVITGTTSYNGVHRVTASTSSPATTFDTDVKYVANETGTFAIGMRSFVMENSTIGVVGQDSPQDAIDNLKAQRIRLQNVRMENFSTIGIDLEDPANFPVAGYQSIDIQDCDFIGNSASTMFAIRSETTAFSQPNVINWERNRLRSIGAGTLFVTQTSSMPYLVREKGMKRSLLTANTTLTSEQSGTLFRVDAADLTITLPPVSSAATGGAGLSYTFVMASSGLSSGTGLRLSPNSSDKIMGNGFVSADNQDLILGGGTDREGDAITIVSDGVDGWYVASRVGTWTSENGLKKHGGPALLYSSGTQVGNVGTGEDDLMSYTIKNGDIQKAGDVLDIVAEFTIGQGTANKRIRAYIDASPIYDSTAKAHNAGRVIVRLRVVMGSDNSGEVMPEVVSTEVVANDPIVSGVGPRVGATLPVGAVIKFTGEASGSSPDDDDVTLQAMTIQYTPGP